MKELLRSLSADEVGDKVKEQLNETHDQCRVVQECLSVVLGGRCEAASCKAVLQELERYSPRFHDDLRLTLMEELFNALQQAGKKDQGIDLEGLVAALDALAGNTLAKLLLLTEIDMSVCGMEGIHDAITYRNYVMDRVLRCHWPSRLVLSILRMLRDMGLDQPGSIQVALKMRPLIPQIEPSLLPLVSYEMMLIARTGDKSIMLRALVLGCEEMLREALKSPIRSRMQMQALGTVFMHFDFAIKQDQGLGDAFIRIVQSREVPLRPFALAMIVSAARQQRFEQKVIDMIKSYVLNALKWKQITKQSVFIKCVYERMKAACGENVDEQGLFVDIADSLLGLIRASNAGWDYLVPGLLQIGFDILDLQPSHRDPVMTDRLMSDTSPSGILQLLPSVELDQADVPVETHAVRLGIRMLRDIFKLHPSARKEIVDQTLFRLLTLEQYGESERSSKAKQSGEHESIEEGSNTIPPALVLLGQIVDENPDAFRMFSKEIKGSLDYIQYLRPWHARRLVQSLLPLMRLCGDLRDDMMLVFRKAIFSRSKSSRLVSLHGFFALVRWTIGDQTPFEMSQSSVSQGSSRSLSDEAVQFYMEVAGCFRRAMTQQLSVRERLYEGLLSLFTTGNSIRPFIFELLHSRLNELVDLEDNPYPLNLDLCIDAKGERCEPLDVLLRVIVECLTIAADEQDQSGSSYESVYQLLSHITEQMCSSRLEDISFEDMLGSQSSSSQQVPVANLRMSLSLACGAVDACMNFLLTATRNQTQNNRNVISSNVLDQIKVMHALRVKLYNVATNKKGAGGKQRGKKKNEAKEKSGAAKNQKVEPMNRVTPQLSLKAVAVILHCVHSESESDDQTSPNKILLEQPALLQLCHQAAAARMKQVNRGLGTPQEQETFCFLWKRILPYMCAELQRLSTIQDSGSSVLILEMLQEAFVSLCVMGRSIAKSVIATFEHLPETVFEVPLIAMKRPENEALVSMLDFLMGLSSQYCSSLRWKDLISCLRLLSLLQRMADEETLSKVKEFAKTIYHSFQVVDPVAAEIVVRYSLESLPARNNFKILDLIAQDLIVLCGDEREDIQPSVSTSLAAMNENTQSTLARLTLSKCTEVLSGFDWVITQLRTVLASRWFDDSIDDQLFATVTKKIPPALTDTAIRAINSQLQSSFTHCTTVLGSLLRPNEILQSHQLLQTLVHLYKSEIQVLRIMIASKASPGPNLKKALEHLGGEFAQDTYALIPRLANKEENGKSSKDMRSVPDLIFCIEQLDHLIIKYSKVCQIPLDKKLKAGPARDFKIDTRIVKRDAKDKKRKKSEQAKDSKKKKGKGKAASDESAAESAAVASDANEEDENRMGVAQEQAA